MMDNRVLLLGWNYGRTSEVPSWEPYEDERPAYTEWDETVTKLIEAGIEEPSWDPCWGEPYEGDRPVADPDTKFEDLPIELPFEL